MKNTDLPIKSKATKVEIQHLKLLGKIYKTVKHFVKAEYSEVPSDILDTLETIKVSDAASALAWKLMFRAMTAALLEMMREKSGPYTEEEIVFDQLEASLEEVLNSQEFTFNKSFFERPAKHEFVAKVVPVLQKFLTLCGYTPKEAENMMIRFPEYFLDELVTEWRKNSGLYESLKDKIETPFDPAKQREAEWYQYQSFLRKQIQEPVFDESFSLQQIYIPLRAFYTLRKISEHEVTEKKHVVDLERYLIEWIEIGDRKDALKVIQGGPGFGKSSFLKMLAAHLSELNKKVLFIPLHRFEIKEDLSDAIGRYFTEADFFQFLL